MKKRQEKKDKEDRLLEVVGMPVSDDGGKRSDQVMISGEMGIGKSGGPVTITIEDEQTGEAMEINNVFSALLMVEDRRSNSSGWLSLVIGDVSRLNGALKFLSKLTLEGLRRIARSRLRKD